MASRIPFTGIARHRAGTTLIALGGLLLLANAAAKFAGVPRLVAQLAANGFDGRKLLLVATLEALSALLFLVPATRSAGLLLVSAFMGGAVATHVQHDLSVLPPAAFLAVVWLGAWLRHPEILRSANHLEEGKTMDYSRISPWLTRFVLLAATVIFSVIAVKYIVDPVGTVAAYRISLGSPAAVTNVRVGFGAFPLGFALITLSCLVSDRRHLTGLWFVLTLFGVVTAARILGIALDGPAQESLKVLRPELVLSALAGVGLVLERRRRMQPEIPDRPR